VLYSALKDPIYAFNYILSAVMPSFFRTRYVQKTKLSGVAKNYLILSFDCDTEKDIEVVGEVHNQLIGLGVMPVYAVPGELLLKGRDAYCKLHDNGAEFINHGYISHTSYFRESKSYVSTLFYDRLTEEQVREDIIRGDEVCVDVLGTKPCGFRTPHFGTYQKPSHLEFLYSILSELDYKFSSSTTPVKSMWDGALIKDERYNIFEMPVTGCYSYPARILDSWGFRFSPTRKFNEQDYVDQFKQLIGSFNEPKNVGVLNIYADPSQVYDWLDFFNCMELAVDSGFKSISFSDFFNEIENNE